MSKSTQDDDWRREELLKEDAPIDVQSGSLSILFLKGVTVGTLAALRSCDVDLEASGEGTLESGALLLMTLATPLKRTRVCRLLHH